MRNILFIFALIPALICFAAAVSSSGVEMKQGEARAEKLFEKGIGKPWIGGNPPWDQGYYGQYYGQYHKTLTLPIKKDIAKSVHYYPLGSVYGDGHVMLGYGAGALMIPYNPPGYYRAFGCYDSNGRLIGVYIDLAGYYSGGY